MLQPREPAWSLPRTASQSGLSRRQACGPRFVPLNFPELHRCFRIRDIPLPQTCGSLSTHCVSIGTMLLNACLTSMRPSRFRRDKHQSLCGVSRSRDSVQRPQVEVRSLAVKCMSKSVAPGNPDDVVLLMVRSFAMAGSTPTRIGEKCCPRLPGRLQPSCSHRIIAEAKCCFRFTLHRGFPLVADSRRAKRNALPKERPACRRRD